jgi:carbon monoxide dehydrogenase subunit G
MEHEVYVPVPAERLREALTDPARVSRAVPGLQRDAGGAPLSGRLKVRFGGTSVTYRGTARVTGGADGTYTVEGDGAETRGTGRAVFVLALRLRDTDAGTTVVFDGTATADGRVADLPATSVASAATRLLNRFAENLAAVAVEPRDESGGALAGPAAAPAVEPAADPEVGEGSDAPEAAEDIAEAADGDTGPAGDEDPHVEPDAGPHEDTHGESPADGLPEVHTSIFDTAIPPPSLDADADSDADADPDTGADQDGGGADEADGGEIGVPVSAAPPGGDSSDEPVAEAAHARRTMIGRSAEEVDHSPPRGRYAPVPAPQSASANATLRWAAPAAALALASAIVVGRALRRRQ